MLQPTSFKEIFQYCQTKAELTQPNDKCNKKPAKILEAHLKERLDEEEEEEESEIIQLSVIQFCI